MDKGRVYWITGLSGAGKTTIGTALYNKLHQQKDAVVMLDGDKMRGVYGDLISYTAEDRKRGGLCNAKLCHLLAEQGIDVICCNIAMFDSVRDWSRANNEKYTEVYLKVTMETLMKRDQKGLYSSRAKNLAGVDLKVEEPKNPDVVIYNEGHERPEDIVERIIASTH